MTRPWFSALTKPSQGIPNDGILSDRDAVASVCTTWVAAETTLSKDVLVCRGIGEKGHKLVAELELLRRDETLRLELANR